ncbi:GNAT family N-acetyltransferase [Neobacillus ginsengisoli]|uniref:GNAT superfamily N-acetyltransferase n=1 Tax=Neobacillus ginsengisoli TaxID=904295 RepID=A0ABT9XQS0_9BACI|nr:GNAT family N-acetyltransferase [Neobacillus ginsengisoli]MDQ0197899.1 GNAT superfamily N-acetyltransferase [Neobacillus ginsengisoli]
MKLSLSELENHKVVQLTQDNMISLMRFWASCTSYFQAIEDEKIFRVKSSLPHPLVNNIIKSNIEQGALEFVKTTIQDYKEHHIPFLWRLWDHDTPQDIGNILIDNSALQIHNTVLMAIDLASFQPLSELLPDLKIQAVRNHEGAAAFTVCSSAAFGIPDFLRNAVTETMAKQDQNIENYVGYLGGTAVTTATSFYSDGIAGIYNVSTLPEFQGKGMGMEIMTALLLKAKLDGYKMAILHATPAGIRLYEKLGFHKYGEMRQFLFS